MIRKLSDWQQALESTLTQINALNTDLSMSNLTSFSLTADVINRYLDAKLVEFAPISRTGYHILRILTTNGGSMNQTKLSKIVYRTKHTITSSVDSLEKHGWVKRESVRGDRRVNNVTITIKGLDLIKNSTEERVEVAFVAMSCLGEREQRQLRLIIPKLRKHIMNL